MLWLSDKIEFPPYELASPEGIIALGGDLSAKRLLHAYQRGIFPWFSENDPIIWHCPPKRMVLFPEELKVSKSMLQVLRNHAYKITENKAFEEVIRQCKTISRKDGFGTWITDEIEKSYIELHHLGYAKSIEVWRFLDSSRNDKELVGGLYGVEIGKVFCGESMFSKKSNTSKLALIKLAQSNQYNLIDCQVYNKHLASLGAREVDRDDFLKYLK